MRAHRTEAQESANQIDMDLAKCLRRAEGAIIFFPPERQGGWKNILGSLRAARVHVRLEMHPDDRNSWLEGE